VVVLCLLGALFIFGGLGEAFTPYVPRAVLIAAGVVYGGLGLALVRSGVADLIDRARARRGPRGCASSSNRSQFWCRRDFWCKAP
jgi:hypothetical protein